LAVLFKKGFIDTVALELGLTQVLVGEKGHCNRVMMQTQCADTRVPDTPQRTGVWNDWVW
jgi:hypothetical protein